MIFEGDLNVSDWNLDDLKSAIPEITEVTGRLEVGVAGLNFPALRRVGRSVNALADKVVLPALEYVGRSFFVREFAGDVLLPSLRKVEGVLLIEGLRSNFPVLETVGALRVIGEEAALPGLRLVEGGCRVDSPTNLPALRRIGGSLEVHARSSVFNVLEEVGYNLLLEADDGDMSVPKLKSVGGFLKSVKSEKEFDFSQIKFGAGKLIALHRYGLHYGEDGRYRAGCRGPWTADQALAHWSWRGDDRARKFVSAILENERSKSCR